MDFLAGLGSDEQKSAIEQHLDHCERCSSTIGLYGGTFAAVGEPDDEPLGPDRRFAGRYVIRECVGFGSGGTVYKAWDPELDRVVALKVLRAGAGGTTQPAHRWTREAKVMAKVVHPNVVTVHDVGVADDNPFIATEFVQGSTLDKWLQAEPRSWSAVLDVFLAAGRGLVAIHACGLVHRDFKPHNVMVGDDGRVRVTDFGLARLVPEIGETEEELVAEVLSSEMLAETLLSRTRTGTLVGTPSYMSPEQWRGRKADARSDQFSFCVALYEGLYGRRPFAGDTAALLGQNVCEGNLRPIPAGRRIPRWLAQAILRGLEVDPADRFADMRALVHALTERPRRMRRRITTAVLGLGFVGVAAFGYAVASLPVDPCRSDSIRLSGVWDDATRSDVAAALGVAPAEIARETTASIDAWVGTWQRVAESACRDRQAGDAALSHEHELRAACLDRRLAELHAVTAVLRHADPATAGRATAIVGTLSSPDTCADTQALVLVEPAYGSAIARHVGLRVAAESERVEALRVAGDLDGAEALARQLVAQADTEAEADHAVRAEALVALGLVLAAKKQPDDAEPVLRDAAWAAEASGHVDAAATAWIELINVLGGQRENYEDGVAAAERAAAAVHRLRDPERAMQLASNRAVIESIHGRYEEAVAQHREVLRQAEALYGKDDHRQVARVHMNLAAALSYLGRLDEALEHARRGAEIHERRYPHPHPVTADMLNSVGALQFQSEDREGARATLTRALQMAEVTLDPNNPTIGAIESNLAQIDLDAKRFDVALARYERVLAIYRATHGDVHADVANALHNLASVQDKAGDRETAIATYRQALAMRKATSGPEHPSTANTMHNLGLVLVSTGSLDEGIAHMERALALRERLAVDPFRRASSCFMLARAYEKKGDLPHARELAERARAHLQSIAPRHADILQAVESWLAEHD